MRYKSDWKAVWNGNLVFHLNPWWRAFDARKEWYRRGMSFVLVSWKQHDMQDYRLLSHLLRQSRLIIFIGLYSHAVHSFNNTNTKLKWHNMLYCRGQSDTWEPLVQFDLLIYFPVWTHTIAFHVFHVAVELYLKTPITVDNLHHTNEWVLWNLLTLWCADYPEHLQDK